MMMTSVSNKPWDGWEEVPEIQNKVIAGAIEQNSGYFEPKIEEVLKNTCYLSVSRHEDAFMNLIIDRDDIVPWR